jgi:hypothetical protein
MKNQCFYADIKHDRIDHKTPRSEKEGSRSRGVSKIAFEMLNNTKLSIFPRKNQQQQITRFAGYSFSLGNIDGFEGVIMSYL